MREVSFQRNALLYPDGSCLASFGNTRVLCTATIQEEVPPFREGKGGWLTAEYGMLPGSTGGGRKPREVGKRSGRSVEIQRLIGRSLRAAVDLDSLPAVTIIVDCDVLQADGGTRTAAISGGWIALVDALRKLNAETGADEGAFLRGQVAAVSVGIVDDALVCDLDYSQDSRARVDMNVVALDADFVEVQGTGEHGIFTRDELGALLNAAEEGLSQIRQVQGLALGP